MRTSQKTLEAISTIGVDLGKNSSTWLGWISGAPSFCSRRYPMSPTHRDKPARPSRQARARPRRRSKPRAATRPTID
jgi:hypothetical protein